MHATREQIMQAHPLDAYLTSTGREIVVKGNKATCLCPFHADTHPSLSLDVSKGVWYCFPCKLGGTVIDMEMRLNQLTVKQAMKSLAEKANLWGPDDEKRHKVAVYDYKDATGKTVMKIDRIEEGTKKTFLPHHTGADGKEIFSLDGVERVLYRLNTWGGLPEVALVEGEKCVHAMQVIGFPATTNPGGSAGWLDGYSVYLKDKHVDIWPDTDPAGEKWIESVMASLAGKVASLRVMRVPSPYNDVADLVIAKGDDEARNIITEIMGQTSRIAKGVILPLLSMAECYERYQARIRAMDDRGVDLSKWLKPLRMHLRNLVPGDLVAFLADTGVGKTTLLIDLAYTLQLPTVIFQLELTVEDICERFIARDQQQATKSIEMQSVTGKVFRTSPMSHVYVSDQASVTVDYMTDIIGKSELKMGVKPVLVLIDYVGLIQGEGGTKAEKIATIAESLKRMAKTTGTVVIMASQVRRDQKRDRIGLHDGKDSSSIECSAQLVIAIERPTQEKVRLTGLKSTKCASGWEVEAVFNGDCQRIYEKDDGL